MAAKQAPIRDGAVPMLPRMAWVPAAAVLRWARGWGSNQFTPMLLVYSHTLGLGTGTLEAMFGAYALGLIPGLLIAGTAVGRPSDGALSVVIPAAVICRSLAQRVSARGRTTASALAVRRAPARGHEQRRRVRRRHGVAARDSRAAHRRCGPAISARGAASGGRHDGRVCPGTRWWRGCSRSGRRPRGSSPYLPHVALMAVGARCRSGRPPRR